MSLWL